MNVRRPLNWVLQRYGYQVARIADYEPCYFSQPEVQIEVDDRLIAGRVSPRRKHVWLVAPPKSGSTWLSALLIELLGWPVVPLQNGYYQREQEVDRRPILNYPTVNIFSPHQHCRASQPTLDFIRECRVTTIVQSRNVFDSIISFRDHLVSKDGELPMVCADTSYAELSEQEQYDFVIEMMLPWYMNFYGTWFRQLKDSPGLAFLAPYERLVTDPHLMLREILDFVGEQRTGAEIDLAIEKAKGRFTRKNKGVIGRGNQTLTTAQISKIQGYRKYFPRIDFSVVGL